MPRRSQCRTTPAEKVERAKNLAGRLAAYATATGTATTQRRRIRCGRSTCRRTAHNNPDRTAAGRPPLSGPDGGHPMRGCAPTHRLEPTVREWTPPVLSIHPTEWNPPSGTHRVEGDDIDGSGAAHPPSAFLLDLGSGQGETHRLHSGPLHRTEPTLCAPLPRADRTGARTAHRVEAHRMDGGAHQVDVVRAPPHRCAPGGCAPPHRCSGAMARSAVGIGYGVHRVSTARRASRSASKVSAVSSWSGSGMTLTTNRMMLRAMPGTAVVGESRAQSRSADSRPHPTSSRTKESAHRSASPSTAVTGQTMSSASCSRMNASSGLASDRSATEAPPPVWSARGCAGRDQVRHEALLTMAAARLAACSSHGWRADLWTETRDFSLPQEKGANQTARVKPGPLVQHGRTGHEPDHDPLSTSATA